MSDIASLESNLSRLAAELPGLPQTEILMARLLVFAGRKLSATLDERLRPLGLSEVEFRLLVSLIAQHGEPLNPGTLCNQISQSPANITRITDGLVERGLISRVPSATDRRRLLLQLTAEGRALMHDLTPAMWPCLQHVFSEFSAEEMQVFTALLKRLAGSLMAAETDTEESAS